MEKITKEKFLGKVCLYNFDEFFRVKRAYLFAEKHHENQFRASGEEYITHPLNVANNLADFYADGDTLCAGLLHDVLEDTKVTYTELENIFGKNVATLVKGVTNLSLANFDSTEEMNLYNNRKILMSITTDPRILIIKLFDRLHNMRTLEYKAHEKQIKKAIETNKFYVPLAENLGIYKIKRELEDLSFKYIDRDLYDDISMKREDYYEEKSNIIAKAISLIDNSLKNNNIDAKISFRFKNITPISKNLNKGLNIEDIHNLFGIKVVVDDIEDCYQVLRVIHEVFPFIDSKFKDYISTPKTNMYKALHTTIKAEDNTLMQIRIKTEEMDKIDTNGILEYWKLYKGKAKDNMLNDLKENFQFLKSLSDIDEFYEDDKDFFKHIYSELYAEKIYINSDYNSIIELPKGSTVVDYACVFNPKNISNLVGAKVNGKFVSICTVLNNLDNVSLIIKDNINNDVSKCATTTTAKKLILKK